MMPREKIEISNPNILVVEGDEERFFFDAFIRHLKLRDIQVLPIGGKTKLRNNLSALCLAPNFSKVNSILIVRDTNNNPQAALQSVKDSLRAAKLPCPGKAYLLKAAHPRVGVMLLPDENTPGALEDLCLRAVKEDPAQSCIKDYFICLKQKGISQPSNMPKAKIQVYLASKRNPGKRLGEAAQANYFPFNDKAFCQIKDFLVKSLTYN